MPKTWLTALGAYCYPVQLSMFGKAAGFPNFFVRNITGDRTTTMQFEDYFRAGAPKAIEVWYEVVFWKLFSQNRVREGTTNRVVCFVQQNAINPGKLWSALQGFVNTPTILNFQTLRSLLGQSYGLAVPLTFAAFACPLQYPMLDKKVAPWVNQNGLAHSAKRNNRLVDFKSYVTKGATYFRDTDFPAYLKWVWWCREVATVLSGTTEFEWRARDVEMAVFTAYERKLRLNVLP